MSLLAPRDGYTYDHGRDGARLNAQHMRVFELMRDGLWRSLAEIKDATGDPESSISARLRDFRKDKFGGHFVDRRNEGGGLYVYRLTLNRKDLWS